MNADPVCEFYTNHPCPPPVENLDRAREEWQDENRHRAYYHLLWPGKPYRADLKILVGGCGTWQAAKYAICRPEASVVGIDVSTTSLEHTEQLKRKNGLTNLETRRLPVERTAEPEQQFDLIVCTGVLHHLADPDAGLSALRSVLRSDGAMYLMVYAPYGRTGVYAQEYCRKLGIGTSRHEIEDLTALKVPAAMSPRWWGSYMVRAIPRMQMHWPTLEPRDRAYRAAVARVHRAWWLDAWPLVLAGTVFAAVPGRSLRRLPPIGWPRCQRASSTPRWSCGAAR
jgi:SAM-dependent methyltransferase